MFLFFCYPFVSLLPLLLLSVFILYYFGTSLSVLRFKAALSLWRRGSSLLCTWLSTRTSLHTRPLDDWLKLVSQSCKCSLKHYIVDKVNKLGYHGRNLWNGLQWSGRWHTHTHSLAQRLSVFHIYTHKQTHIHQVNGWKGVSDVEVWAELGVGRYFLWLRNFTGLMFFEELSRKVTVGFKDLRSSVRLYSQ